MAGAAGDRTMRQDDRYGERTDGGRRTQQAERPGSGVQDVARVDRQQRRDAAEQHGEQIERDRAEENRMAADIDKARKHRFQAHLPSRLAPWGNLDETYQHARGDEDDGAGGVDRG